MSGALAGEPPEITPMAKDTYDPHKSTTEVRSGDRRQMNVRVLFISFIAVVVMFAIIYFVFFPKYPAG